MKLIFRACDKFGGTPNPNEVNISVPSCYQVTFHTRWIIMDKILECTTFRYRQCYKKKCKSIEKGKKKPVKAEQNRDLDSSKHLDEEKNIPIAALGEFLA